MENKKKLRFLGLFRSFSKFRQNIPEFRADILSFSKTLKIQLQTAELTVNFTEKNNNLVSIN